MSVETVSIATYDKLKSAIVRCIEESNKLNDVLVPLSEKIKSPRRLSQIHNGIQLIDLMERRGILTISDVRGLDDIREIIGDDGLNLVIDTYRNRFCVPQNINKINLYEKALNDQKTLQEEMELKARIKTQEIENNAEKPRNNVYCSSHFEGKMKIKIYDLIASEMGRNFREFGRQLMVKEGEMDDIEIQHKSNKNRTYALFSIFEDRVDPRRIVVHLCDALSTSRRKDIRLKVEDYLSR